MRLQRVPTIRGKERTYYRWQISIPPEAIEELGWQEGDEIGWVVRRSREGELGGPGELRLRLAGRMTREA